MVRRIIGRFGNVFLVLGAAGVGVAVPHLGPYLDPLITPLVVFLVYTSLQGLRLAEIDYSSYALLIALSLCLSYLLLPVVGTRIAESVLRDTALVGFAIALSVPTTAGSAIVWTRLACGDVQLATIISIVSLLIAPAATPIVLTQLVGSQFTVPAASILTDLVVIVGGGVLLTAIVPSDSISPALVERGSTLAILLLIYTAVAGVDAFGIAGSSLLAIVGVSVLLFGFGLGVTAVCERGLGVARKRAIPLFFATSLKNLGIALLISIPLADPLVTVSIIVYYVVQQVGGALIADATT
ncbi:bile acid:sodium symporter [Halorubrum trueperi]|uniref:Bile acid:sodium symporter n=1 Tax=Halorubrum trueperi TaxID=2004704 RepID=A0ABD5UMS6_9EURY